MSLTCPWGCGWKGSADEYSKHYNECPARKKVPEAPPPEEEKLAPKIFRTEEEFRGWLEKQGLTACMHARYL